jgi:hypothetical protein
MFRLGDILKDFIKTDISCDVFGLLIDDCILVRSKYAHLIKEIEQKYNKPTYIVDGIVDYSKGQPLYITDLKTQTATTYNVIYQK